MLTHHQLEMMLPVQHREVSSHSGMLEWSGGVVFVSACSSKMP